MSNDSRPDSRKSRQDLLDELYYLRDIAGEREQQYLRQQARADTSERAVAERDSEVAALRRQLELILHSRSWRLTAPLRWLSKHVGRMRVAGGSGDAGAGPENAPVRSRGSTGPSGGALRIHVQESLRIEDRGDGEPRLYVDITELAAQEGRTGVQRVTRGILGALLDAPALGYKVRAACAPPGQPYRLARSFTSKLLGDSEQALPDVSMAAQPGDVFLGLDHSMRATAEHSAELAAMHERGVRIWFVCNDVLPLSHPEWFPPEVHTAFKAWLETIARVADGVACISLATQSELRQQLNLLAVPRAKPLALAHFYLGADLAAGGDTAAAVSPEQASLIERLRGMDAFLMVGTLEPRKGHAQALQAFESLWAGGSEAILVIAGFPGWMTDVLARRIRHHDEFGKRLFWFMGPDDAVLDRLYTTCTVLLAPSEGEGFGLPLVEAARRGTPILCRELPVFREIAGEHATYFSGRDANSLAMAVRAWLDAYRHHNVPPSSSIQCFTWAESAHQLIDVVLHDRTEAVISGG